MNFRMEDIIGNAHLFDPHSTKPYLLIDVDGVLNIEIPSEQGFKNGRHLKKYDDWKQVDFIDPQGTVPIRIVNGRKKVLNNGKYKFIFSPTMIEKLLKYEEFYQLIFVTTWEQDANWLVADITGFEKLRELPYLKSSMFEKNGSLKDNWWKMLVIEALIEMYPRDFLFLDDEYYRKHREYLERVASYTKTTGAFIKVTPSFGLEAKRFEEIDMFTAIRKIR